MSTSEILTFKNIFFQSTKWDSQKSPQMSIQDTNIYIYLFIYYGKSEIGDGGTMNSPLRWQHGLRRLCGRVWLHQWPLCGCAGQALLPHPGPLEAPRRGRLCLPGPGRFPGEGGRSLSRSGHLRSTGGGAKVAKHFFWEMGVMLRQKSLEIWYKKSRIFWRIPVAVCSQVKAQHFVCSMSSHFIFLRGMNPNFCWPNLVEQMGHHHYSPSSCWLKRAEF